MSDHTPDVPGKTEPELADRLQHIFLRLEEVGRCVWRREVRLLHWGARGKVSTLRADFVASLDGSPLMAFEVKRAAPKAADLGRHLLQCADYARSVVAPMVAEKGVQAWVQQPIRATFLFTDPAAMRPWVREHAKHARRLFGPARVGFAFDHARRGLLLQLCDDTTFWSEFDWRGDARQHFAGGLVNQRARVGNGYVAFDEAGE